MKKSLSILMSMALLASSTVPPISKVSASGHQQDISKFITQADTPEKEPDVSAQNAAAAAATAGAKDYLTDFDEVEFKKNILDATTKLQAQPKLGMALDIQGEVAVVGDLHGDFKAIKVLIPKLQEWLDADRNRKVLFLGDIFDRGDTTHTLDYLLKFYLHNDGKVFMLCGNHETKDAYRLCDPRSLCQPARDELSIQKVETEIMEYFKNLPYAAIINNTTFASHAGIPSLIDCFDKFPPDISISGTKPSKWQDFFTSGDYSEYWIYAMLWSDFYPLEPKTIDEAQQRNAYINGGRLPYVSKDLKAFFGLANQIHFETRAPLNLQNFICAHRHEKGPWSHYELGDGHTVDLIISTPNLLQKVMDSPAYKEKPSSTIGKVLVINGSATPKLLMDIGTQETIPTPVKPHFRTPQKPTEKGTTRVGTTAKVKQAATTTDEVIVCGYKITAANVNESIPDTICTQGAIVPLSSPIIIAAEMNDVEVVKKLLALGADVNRRDFFDRSALDYARKLKNEQIIDLLSH